MVFNKIFSKYGHIKSQLKCRADFFAKKSQEFKSSRVSGLRANCHADFLTSLLAKLQTSPGNR